MQYEVRKLNKRTWQVISGSAVIIDGINELGIATKAAAELNAVWQRRYDEGKASVTPAPQPDPVPVPDPQPQPVPAGEWRPLRIGAGGYLTGMDIHPDGTMVCRTDTYGAYAWRDGEWHQLVTSKTMPAGTPGYGGVYEIRIAPSNSSVWYMTYGGEVYRTDSKGVQWSKTAFAKVNHETSAHPNDEERCFGPKMAIDPRDENTVYVATEIDGVFVTRDGGKGWVSVPSIPKSTKAAHSGMRYASDGSLYIPSAGAGFFKSTDDGRTFANIGGPPAIINTAADKAGRIYATTGEAVHRFDGAWKQMTTGDISHVACNPFVPDHVVIAGWGGNLQESHTNGDNWEDGTNWTPQLTSDDVPWLATTSTYMSSGELVFDPNIKNKLWLSAGVGVWHTILPEDFLFNTPMIWKSQSTGIEQLCANDIVVPPGGKPVLASWDRPVFVIDDPERFPTGYLPPGDFSMGWSVDYATSDPGFIVGLVNWWNNQRIGFTRDGKTWVQFPTQPPVNGAIGGSIAALTPDNIIVCPANKQPPTYTKDGGKTWDPVILPGFPNWEYFHFAYYLKRRTVCADRVKPNTAYIYAVAEGFAGVYETTSGGDTWARVYDGQIVDWSYYNAKIDAMPGRAGELWFTPGSTSGEPSQPFMRSTNGGRVWSEVPGIKQVHTFGFGAPGEVVAAGWVNGVFGIYRTTDNGATWQALGIPLDSLDHISTIAGDPNKPGRVYVGFGGSGFAYRP